MDPDRLAQVDHYMVVMGSGLVKGKTKGGGDLADAIAFGHEGRDLAHHSSLDPGQGQLDHPQLLGVLFGLIRSKDHGGHVVLLFLDLPDRFGLGHFSVCETAKIDGSIGVFLGPFRGSAKGTMDP